MEKYANETLDTGLFPTLCPHGCFVESEDEVCPHGCKSMTLVTFGDADASQTKS